MKRQALLFSVALGVMGCDRGTRHDSTNGYRAPANQQQTAQADEGRNQDIGESYRTDTPQPPRDDRRASDEVREEGQDFKRDVRAEVERAEDKGEQLKEKGKETVGEVREDAREVEQRVENKVNEEAQDLREGTAEAPMPAEPEKVSDKDLQKLDDKDLRGITDDSITRGVEKLNKELFESSTTKKFTNYEQRINALKQQASTNPDVAGEIRELEVKLDEARKFMGRLENEPVTTYRDSRNKMDNMNRELEHSIAALEFRIRALQSP